MKKHANIYLGDNISKPEKYINKLNKIKIIDNFYVVVINNNKLEILHSLLFKQKYYKNLDLTAVAICKSQDTAFEYIRRITELSYKKYNDFRPIDCIDELDDYDIDFLYDDIEEQI